MTIPFKVEEVYRDVVKESKLVNGEHTILECSSCGTQLVDIWVTRPDIEVEWRVRATCPKCGDASFERVVKGGFYQGPCEGFAIDGLEEDKNGVIVFKVIPIS